MEQKYLNLSNDQEQKHSSSSFQGVSSLLISNICLPENEAIAQVYENNDYYVKKSENNSFSSQMFPQQKLLSLYEDEDVMGSTNFAYGNQHQIYMKNEDKDPFELDSQEDYLNIFNPNLNNQHNFNPSHHIHHNNNSNSNVYHNNNSFSYLNQGLNNSNYNYSTNSPLFPNGPGGFFCENSNSNAPSQSHQYYPQNNIQMFVERKIDPFYCGYPPQQFSNNNHQYTENGCCGAHNNVLVNSHHICCHHQTNHLPYISNRHSTGSNIELESGGVEGNSSTVNFKLSNNSFQIRPNPTIYSKRESLYNGLHHHTLDVFSHNIFSHPPSSNVANSNSSNNNNSINPHHIRNEDQKDQMDSSSSNDQLQEENNIEETPKESKQIQNGFSFANLNPQSGLHNGQNSLSSQNRHILSPHEEMMDVESYSTDDDNSEKDKQNDNNHHSSSSSNSSTPSAAAELFVGCNCQKSKCLQLYCQCFALQGYCSDKCNCVDCGNRRENQEGRKIAIDEAIMRNQDAFLPKNERVLMIDAVTGAKKGCSCQKTQCLQKYCECRSSGILCNEFCQCEGCQNCAENYTPPVEITEESIKTPQRYNYSQNSESQNQTQNHQQGQIGDNDNYLENLLESTEKQKRIYKQKKDALPSQKENDQLGSNHSTKTNLQKTQSIFDCHNLDDTITQAHIQKGKKSESLNINITQLLRESHPLNSPVKSHGYLHRTGRHHNIKQAQESVA